MRVRPVTDCPQDALLSFLGRVPEEDRNFFKADTTDPGIVERWLGDRGGRHLVAVDDDGTVCGYAAILPGVGWSSHVAELRLMVGPEHRRRGLGRTLAQSALREALELGLTVIFVEVTAEQTPLIVMFQGMGFEPEALLRDFVRDRAGESHDLLVLTHRVEALWSELSTVGIDEVAG